MIDFGVVKANEQRLTERTRFTQYGALVGTFEYMSPEQAEMNALGVDTRSDFYSLGILLYELLTGRPPLEKLRQACRSSKPREASRTRTARQKALGKKGFVHISLCSFEFRLGAGIIGSSKESL